MRSSIECIPCLARQAMEASGFAIEDEAERERIVRLLIREIAGMDFGKSPPVAAQKMHRLLRRETGTTDPYRAAKRRFNALALQLLPSFERKIAESNDPFSAAVRIAIAGNVIDLGVKGDLSESEAFDVVRGAFEVPVEGDIGAFKEAVASAGKILYLADNAGEIVFDVPLLKMLPAGKLTVAVRGEPVINDATMEDAVVAGIPDIAPVIDNGSDAPGTVLTDCSASFRSAYEGADLVIAKGQGNYETLCDENKNIYFLFKVKCPVVSSLAGLPVGAHVLLQA
ncbi:MAG TPA: ARMT1-like domain-containing protein [Spirochaetota bacterium]|nr:ARMT1-like domain-containing protein [Spirochaetota bacterium]